jgi:F-type H+-transporting ATPase subunit gamma
VTSDKGLCGAYNTNIIQHAIKFIKENAQKEVSLQLLGKKGFLFFQRRPYKIEEYNTETVEKLGLSSLQAEDNKITEMAAKLTKDFEENVYDEIYLFFSKFKSVMKSIPTGLRLLPVEDIGDGPNAPDEKKLIGDSILEPSAEDIFADLLPKYIEAQLRQAIFESLTSEYAARRVAMIAASENADGIIDDLTRSYNRARQEAITNELLEVISGSEALVA